MSLGGYDMLRYHTTQSNSFRRAGGGSAQCSSSTMRLNLKIALCLVSVAAFFTTVSYWSKCSDGPLIRTGSLAVLAHSPAASSQVRYNLNSLSKEELYSLDGDNADSHASDAAIVGGAVSNGGIASLSLKQSDTEDVECLINGDYTVACKKNEAEVYVPFTFLHKYFEVYGKLVPVSSTAQSQVNPAEELSHSLSTRLRFEWQHSYSKYYVPHAKYDPRGIFMNFENFNVEARERVKCISAMDGVPVSTQWDARGYPYAIQISQFGLSHFSKNLTEPEPRITVYEDGSKYMGKWQTAATRKEFSDGKNADIAAAVFEAVADGEILASHKTKAIYKMESRMWRTRDDDVVNDVFCFNTPDGLSDNIGLTLRIDQVLDFVLSVDLRFDSNGSFTVLLEDREKKEQYRIHYVCMSTYVWAEATDVYYGLGVQDIGSGGWRHLTRDVVVDLRKGLAHLRGRGRRLKINAKYRLVSISLHGKGALDNLTVSSSAHLANFFNGVNWLVRGQDAKGGWPIPVERRFNIPGMAALSPGWYSAMAQGQAISVLTRAYHVTGDEKYLDASLKATELFHTPAKDGGILARFLDRYAWYEEYPTMPSSFVLNGFIYSLIGLYDLKSALPEDDPRAYNVTELYKEGMISLSALLPLFDAGYTSIYDLRHFALGVAPNLARWDYHTTHISQLLLLATIDDSPVLRSTAERWIEYMKGKRASHN